MADYLAGNGSLWIQPDGPNTEPVFLGCHELGDIEKSRGEANTVFAPSPRGPSQYDGLVIYNGEPGAVSASLITPLGQLADWLEGIQWPVPLYVMLSNCGRKDIFSNYERAMILEYAMITSEKMGPMVARTPTTQGESLQTFDISALALYRIMEANIVEQYLAGVVARVGLSIAFEGIDQPPGQYGTRRTKEQYGYIGLQGLLGAVTNVYYTENGGLNWDPCGSQPFQDFEDVGMVWVIPNGIATHRVLVARTIADLAAPAEVAYSDDGGTTWTGTTVGAINGQYPIGQGNSMIAVNAWDVYLVTTGGYVYFSDDSGVTWTAQTAGVLTVEDLYAVSFCSETSGIAAGDNNIILVTTNGQDWAVCNPPPIMAGSNIRACAMLSNSKIWVGYEDGTLYYTEDGGNNWIERVYPGVSLGEILSLRFANHLVGYMVWVNIAGTAGQIYRTINGGYSWEALEQPAGSGIAYNCEVLDSNVAYFATG